MVTVLGAGGVLAAVLSATAPAALAQPTSAQAPSLPKACVAIEALVGDGASGSSLGLVRCSASVPAARAR